MSTPEEEEEENDMSCIKWQVNSFIDYTVSLLGYTRLCLVSDIRNCKNKYVSVKF